MATKFILDRRFQEETQTISQILELTKKLPYPDHETVHLARFVDSCFYVIEEVKRKENIKKEELELKKCQLEEAIRKRKEEIVRKKELEALAPSPELQAPEELPLLTDMEVPAPPKPLEKREYVIQIYNMPIGIFIDKNESGKYLYHSVEPVLDSKVIDIAKDLFGSDLENNPSLFSDQKFLAKIYEKVSSKSNTTLTDLFKQRLLYYLQRDILGAGQFDTLLYDEKVQTIYYETANKPIRIEYDTLGNIETNIVINNNDLVNKLIKRISSTSGKSINSSIIDISFQGLKFEGIIGQGGANSKLTIRRLKHDI